MYSQTQTLILCISTYIVYSVWEVHLCSSYVQYIFLTEVDDSKKKCVHDELARLLVQYVKQQTQDEDHIEKLLDVRIYWYPKFHQGVISLF